ncbi:hypothetical protein C2D16_21995, partial [Escherichia coli]|nr:hypothetical protein [Escherichia coli]
MKKESGNTLKRSLLSVLVTFALCTPHAMAFTPSVPNGEKVTGEVVENGTQTIQKGGEASHTTINKGGTQHVSSGGTAIDTTIYNGGTLNIDTGGSATSVQQKSGAALTATTATGTTVKGTNGLGEFSIENGQANNVLLENGGELTVVNGTTATGTTVNDGGLMMTAGTDSDTTVQAGGRYILGKYTATPDDPDAAWTYADTATAQNLTVTGGTAQV